MSAEYKDSVPTVDNEFHFDELDNMTEAQRKRLMQKIYDVAARTRFSERGPKTPTATRIEILSAAKLPHCEE